MKPSQQQQAHDLYFHTDLTKTQIAESIGVSRRSLHYWIRDNQWERIRRNAELIPSLMTEKCYYVLGHYTDAILAPEREGMPATTEEINGMYKLTLMLNRLRSRATLGESMESLGWLVEAINADNPQLAEQVQPYINTYISTRAARTHTAFMPPKFTPSAHRERSQTPPEEMLIDHILDRQRSDRQAAAAQAEKSAPAHTAGPQPSPVSAATPGNDPVQATPVASSSSTTQVPVPGESTPPATPYAPLDAQYPSLHTLADRTPPPPKQKTDLRKLLRGTATTGPTKNLRKQALAA